MFASAPFAIKVSHNFFGFSFVLTLFGFQLSPLVLQMSVVSRSKRVVLCGRPNIAGNVPPALWRWGFLFPNLSIRTEVKYIKLPLNFALKPHFHKTAVSSRTFSIFLFVTVQCQDYIYTTIPQVLNAKI